MNDLVQLFALIGLAIAGPLVVAFAAVAAPIPGPNRVLARLRSADRATRMTIAHARRRAAPAPRRSPCLDGNNP